MNARDMKKGPGLPPQTLQNPTALRSNESPIMNFSQSPHDEPRITLADIKSALSLERDKSKSELISDLGGFSDRPAVDRDRWMCELGRYVAILTGLRLIRDLETAANRLDSDKPLGGAV